jgi:CHAT domain-containing protein
MKAQSSYEEYLYQKIDELQLININDACMGIALAWVGDPTFEIPPGVINEKQKAEISLVMGRENDEEYNLGIASLREKELKPIHEWLVKNICKSIQQNEIKPLILKLTINGDIIPELTYVYDENILKWLGYRGIEVEIYPREPFYLNKDFNNCIESIFSCINHYGDLLSLRIRGLDYEEEIEDIIEDIDEDEDYDFIKYEQFKEIRRLRNENEMLKNQQNKPNTRHAINKHSERHAKKREQILGAALSILASYPEQCKNKAGNFESTKIRSLIEEKALLFWPAGEPDLSTDTIERLIREWINKTAK